VSAREVSAPEAIAAWSCAMLASSILKGCPDAPASAVDRDAA
jgi:hypothetical protein